jgi:hypothetical protein
MVVGNTVYPKIWQPCDGGVIFARPGNGRKATGPQGGAGQGGGQRQAWDKMPQGTMFGAP